MSVMTKRRDEGTKGEDAEDAGSHLQDIRGSGVLKGGRGLIVWGVPATMMEAPPSPRVQVYNEKVRDLLVPMNSSLAALCALSWYT